jgi:hypothetical protein
MVRNWQGLYRCPIHNEERQPQDYVRGVKDDPSVPWSQPEIDSFTTWVPKIPVTISPTALLLAVIGLDILDEDGINNILTESGNDITIENTTELGFIQLLLQPWIQPASYLWSWKSGGTNITINTPTLVGTILQTTVPGSSGVIQCLVTDIFGDTGLATANVTS